MQVVIQTLQTIIEANNPAVLKNLVEEWRSQLALDCPELSAVTRESIIRWLIGNDLERFTQLDSTGLEVAHQQIAHRYRILRQRYLGASPEQLYRNLMTQLGSLILYKHKARACVALNQNCQKLAVDVLQQVLQELLTCDLYLHQQIVWIAQCSRDAELRNALLLASLEEYCSRQIHHRPLIFYQFLDYLHRIKR